jgi:F-type H+-transporting ATPase subunit delta
MSGTRAAQRYAKAILSLALEQNSEADVYNDMSLIAGTIEESVDLQLLLSSPVLKPELKRESLHRIFKSEISGLSSGVIDILIDNKRLSSLKEVSKKYIESYDALKGKQVAKVTTAVPLTRELKVQVSTKVKEITGKEATIENIVNPEILGGFILRIGDVQYDASITNKLQVLRRKFEEESYN